MWVFGWEVGIKKYKLRVTSDELEGKKYKVESTSQWGYDEGCLFVSAIFRMLLMLYACRDTSHTHSDD